MVFFNCIYFDIATFVRRLLKLKHYSSSCFDVIECKVFRAAFIDNKFNFNVFEVVLGK